MRTVARAALLLLALASNGAPARADSVYRWVDAEGVIHISSEQPPRGVQAERINVGTATRKRAPAPSSSSTSPAQLAGRTEVLDSLRTRECVISLEALDRLTSGAQPTSSTEIRRLQQTAELNCSKNPARRREQEDMAARLRVANSPACTEARNQLAALLAPGSRAAREQVKAQQDFVDGHCTAPVR